MAHFSYILVLTAVLVFSSDQVRCQDPTALIEGSGNGEIIDGSGGGGEDIVVETDVLPPECTAEFKNSNEHTMCKYFDDLRVKNSGVSDADKQIIVDLHNKLRGNVEPPATDLSKLVWDDKIASVAQKWAKQCTVGHDKNRRVPSYGISIGQNAAGGQSSWEGAIMAWYNEVEMFKYGEDPNVYLGPGGWKKVGHYTQIVNNGAYSIGCGYAECDSSSYRRYYVCNYGEAQYGVSKPYTNGTRCSSCPHACKDGLCDCDGLTCQHDGTLDIDSCTCSCPRTYTGPKCETLSCPDNDKSNCWSIVLPKHCNVGSVRADCPYMCGICGGPEGVTPPPEHVSKHGCTYKGKRPTAAICSSYGDKGSDMRYCETKGGEYGCNDCIKYSNVKSDFCPVMCGICEAPCEGLMCQNGGELDPSTCQCICPKPFVGETCDAHDCTDIKDHFSCWDQLQPSDCIKYNNVPDMCPWMCGSCGKAGATPPPEFKSSFGCTYVGQRSSKEECAAFGRNGADIPWVCASGSGPYDCAACKAYSNVAKDYCPVMCGVCDP